MSEPTLVILGPRNFAILHRTKHGIPAIYTTNNLHHAEAYLDKLEHHHPKPRTPMAPKRPKKISLVTWFIKWLWH